MRRRISIWGRVRPSVRPSVRRSVGPYVPCYFRTSKNDISEARMTTKFNRDNVQQLRNLLESSECKKEKTYSKIMIFNYIQWHLQRLLTNVAKINAHWIKQATQPPPPPPPPKKTTATTTTTTTTTTNTNTITIITTTTTTPTSTKRSSGNSGSGWSKIQTNGNFG